MKSLLLRLPFLYLLCCFTVLQGREDTLILKTPGGDLQGSLLVPESKTPMPLVLIIAGSGPTDRDGNNSYMKNNSLLMMARELHKHGIASFRFDKRGIGESSDVEKNEREMTPGVFVQDVRDWVTLLSRDKRFSAIILAGHSEGSLLGMLAAGNNPEVSGFISIAGAGRPIDEILKDQFSHIQAEPREIIYSLLDKLKQGDTIPNIPPILYSVFRPDIQPYLIAWMKYDPREEIRKLNIPILITTGTTDIQVKESDAKLLSEARPDAELKIIPGMNHVLKHCDTMDKQEQMEIYANPDLPLHPEFAASLVDFVSRKFIMASGGRSRKK